MDLTWKSQEWTLFVGSISNWVWVLFSWFGPWLIIGLGLGLDCPLNQNQDQIHQVLGSGSNYVLWAACPLSSSINKSFSSLEPKRGNSRLELGPAAHSIVREPATIANNMSTRGYPNVQELQLGVSWTGTAQPRLHWSGLVSILGPWAILGPRFLVYSSSLIYLTQWAAYNYKVSNGRVCDFQDCGLDLGLCFRPSI